MSKWPALRSELPPLPKLIPKHSALASPIVVGWLFAIALVVSFAVVSFAVVSYIIGTAADKASAGRYHAGHGDEVVTAPAVRLTTRHRP
jgi:hypothetical protein